MMLARRDFSKLALLPYYIAAAAQVMTFPETVEVDVVVKAVWIPEITYPRESRCVGVDHPESLTTASLAYSQTSFFLRQSV